MIDESELWELFTKMRRILWNVPHAEGSIDHARIVQEFPPLGSRFTPQGGYFTPDNICVTRLMRTQVMGIKSEYDTEAKEQHQRTSQTDKAKVYMIERRMPIVPQNYGDEPYKLRKQPMTLQDRPPTPYVPTDTNKSEYGVKRLLDSQNLGHRDRPGLHRPNIPARTPQPRDAGN
jgi:hypothetical protein